MRILFVTQRYGAGIAGGAEAACRELAQRLAVRGHEIEVVTSCAANYQDWADEFEPGDEVLDTVLVHRLRARARRDPAFFAPLHRRTLTREVSLAVQRDWLRIHGPALPVLVPFLVANSARFDVVVFYAYLFAPAGLGLPVAACRTATVVHPAAHDEPFLFLDVFDPELRHADGISCQTVEEVALVHRRIGPTQRTRLIGMGVETETVGDGERFRARFGLADRPYLLYLGRVDPGKGADELYRFAQESNTRGTVDVSLVFAGENVMRLPPAAGVVFTGFVDDQTKHDALAGATVYAQPSYFESFSISLCEAWVHSRPALVQGACAVLAGQVGRAKGGLAYRTFADFDVTLRRLISDAALRETFGRNGHDYVIANYRWASVIDRYEAFLEEISAGFVASRRPDWFTPPVGATA